MSAVRPCGRLAGHHVPSGTAVQRTSFRCSIQQPCRSSRRCRVHVGRDEQPLPVVSDATVLPPPATGSQYQRNSWANSWASSNGSGGGGTGGRSQARTRDWGPGPGSSGLLLYLMYRARLLLLYGVWVTVLYGAVHGVCDLARKLGGGVVTLAGRAASLAGSSSSNADASSADASNVNCGAGIQDVAAAAAAAAAHVPGFGDAAGSDGGAAAGCSAAAESGVEGQRAWLLPQQQEQQPKIDATGLRDRPTARFFNDLMSVVAPLYLVLLGSVAFFSTMSFPQ